MMQRRQGTMLPPRLSSSQAAAAAAGRRAQQARQNLTLQHWLLLLLPMRPHLQRWRRHWLLPTSFSCPPCSNRG